MSYFPTISLRIPTKRLYRHRAVVAFEISEQLYYNKKAEEVLSLCENLLISANPGAIAVFCKDVQLIFQDYIAGKMSLGFKTYENPYMSLCVHVLGKDFAETQAQLQDGLISDQTATGLLSQTAKAYFSTLKPVSI